MMEAVSLRQTVRDVLLRDLNANSNTYLDEFGRPARPPVSVSSANTDPPGLATFFSDVLADPDQLRALEAFDVIAFKSCYSASQIRSDEQFTAFRQAYEDSIAQYIDGHPHQRFVVMSPPPRRALLTTRSAAFRAREFSRFLGEFVASRPNCSYCDLFDCLAGASNVLRRRYCRWSPRDQHPNRAGARVAGDALRRALETAAERSR
jgi:hypothetical protein